MDQLVTWLRAQWDRAAGVGLMALGAVLLVTGWIGVTGASTTKDQLSYLASGGLGGLFCLGAGVGLLVSANLADEWRKLDELARAVRGETAGDETKTEPAAPPFELDAAFEETRADERLSI